jgi:hypothetical protein
MFATYAHTKASAVCRLCDEEGACFISALAPNYSNSKTPKKNKNKNAEFTGQHMNIVNTNINVIFTIF